MIDLQHLFTNEHAIDIAVVSGDGLDTFKGNFKAFLRVTTLDYSEFGQDTVDTLILPYDHTVEANDYVLINYSGSDIAHIKANGKRAETPRMVSKLISEVEIK